MTLTDRLKTAAGRAGRALVAMSASPAAPGFEPKSPDRADRSPETVRQLRSPDALFGRTTYYAGPSQTRYGSYVGTGLEPQTIYQVQVLRNNGYPQLWSELIEQQIERDGHLGGIYDTRRQSVADKPYRVHPARRGDETASALAGVIERVVDKIDEFDQTIEDLLSATAYGYAAAEIVWHYALIRVGAGAIVLKVPRSVEWVHWKHFRFDRNTDEPYIWLSTGDYSLPPHKFVFHASAGTGLKERRGFMGSCVWLSAAKRWAERDWLVYAKLFGIPNILARYPEGKEEYGEHREQYVQFLKDWGEGIPALLPDDLTCEITREPAGRSGDIHGAIVGWANSEMSKRILGSTLTVEMGGAGSYATADVHRDAPYMRSRADAKKLAATLRRDLITPIIEENVDALAGALGKPPAEILELVPRWSWRIEREMTPRDRLAVYQGGSDYGFRVSKTQFSDEFGLDEAIDDEDLLPGKVEPVTSGGALVPTAVVADSPQPVSVPVAPQP